MKDNHSNDNFKSEKKNSKNETHSLEKILNRY